jgi:hypothetical protein
MKKTDDLEDAGIEIAPTRRFWPNWPLKPKLNLKLKINSIKKMMSDDYHYGGTGLKKIRSLRLS